MKIIQIFVVSLESSKDIYGLGDDGKPYCWSPSKEEWLPE